MREHSLCNLLEGETLAEPKRDLSISNLTFDSRTVRENSLFFAVSGHSTDGLRFVPDAVAKGASAVVVEGMDALVSDPGVEVCRVRNIRRALATSASRFFGEPSNKLVCVGVTGTNGKTSISWIVAQAAASIFGPWLQLGTLGVRTARDGEMPSFSDLATTTPDPLSIQGALRRGLDEGAKGAVMEVSSHASVQMRTHAVAWDVAAFTNLTRDHLDYHESMDDYFDAKRRLFVEELRHSAKQQRTAVVCVDNEYGLRLAQELQSDTDVNLITVSTQGKEADHWLRKADCRMNGSSLEIDSSGELVEVNTRLAGSFNVENLLTSYGILRGLGASGVEIARAMKDVPEVPGRIERVYSEEFAVFVDYAHTPAALEAVCTALRGLNPKRMIVVFGCGGDRDKGKRPQMGQVVRESADFAIVTSDNPRTEDPERIVDDICEVFQENSAFERIVDRRSAIARAIELAGSGDIVLIAGKGHEPYQEINGVRHDFDDRAVAREYLKTLVAD